MATPNALPVIGDLVEARYVLKTDGSVIGGITINDGTEVLDTSAVATFGTDPALIILNGPTSGFVGIQASKISRGLQSLTFMRAL